MAIALSSGFFLLLPVVQGATATGISPAEAVQCMNREKGVVVDVCGADEYAQSHIKLIAFGLEQLACVFGLFDAGGGEVHLSLIHI